MNKLSLLSYSSVIAVYILILLGGLVTATEAGLACPDWPLCYGQVLPPLTPGILIELTHRFWTVITSSLIVATAILAWRSPIASSRVRHLSAVSVVVLIAQILLGMASILLRSHPLIVTAHLGLATGLFASVLASALYLSRG